MVARLVAFGGSHGGWRAEEKLRAPACCRQVYLETAVRQKLVTNATKYPVEKAKGVVTKYDRL